MIHIYVDNARSINLCSIEQHTNTTISIVDIIGHDWLIWWLMCFAVSFSLHTPPFTLNHFLSFSQHFYVWVYTQYRPLSLVTPIPAITIRIQSNFFLLNWIQNKTKNGIQTKRSSQPKKNQNKLTVYPFSLRLTNEDRYFSVWRHEIWLVEKI